MLEDETIWYPASDGMANVRVDMLRLRKSDNTVLAATHGRGLFTAPYDLDIFYVGQEEFTQKKEKIRIYPNPANSTVNIEMKEGNRDDIRVFISDLSGKILSRRAFGAENGTLVHRIDIGNLKPGLYLLTVRSGKETTTNKLIVQ